MDTSQDPSQNPSEAALAAAYQATARWFAAEQQHIWTRTTLFVAVNTALLVSVQYLPPLHPVARVLLPIGGLIYSVVCYLGFRRTWKYYDYLARLLREQEQALKLGSLGAFTRAKKIIDGGLGEAVGGELTVFKPLDVIFRARVFSDATSFAFIAAYTMYLVYGAFQFRPL